MHINKQDRRRIARVDKNSLKKASRDYNWWVRWIKEQKLHTS